MVGSNSNPISINLDNPIFVIYIDVRGMARVKAESMIQMTTNIFNYDNVTSWFLPIQDCSRIDLIWKGSKFERSFDLDFLQKSMDIVSSPSLTNEEKVQKIRDLKIDNLI